MIEVAIWFPSGLNVGHAAAQVGTLGEEHASYISWWPGSGVVLKADPGSVNGRSDDERAEGRAADETVEFHDLNEPAATGWWRAFLASYDANYQLAFQNCSWAVIQALKAAGSDRYFPWYKVNKTANFELKLPSADRLLMAYLRGMRSALKAGATFKTSSKMGLVYAADDVGPFWSPTDAFDYCVELKLEMQKMSASGKATKKLDPTA